LSVAFIGPLIALSESLLNLWVGMETANGGAPMLRTLVLAGLLSCGSNVFSYCAMGVGRADIFARMTFAYAGVAIISTVVLISVYGVKMAGMGIVVASALRLALSLYYTRTQLFPRSDWTPLMVSTLLPLVIGIAFSIALYFVQWRPASWTALSAQYSLYMLALIFANAAVAAMTPRGRDLLRRVHSTLLHREGKIE